MDSNAAVIVSLSDILSQKGVEIGDNVEGVLLRRIDFT